MTQQNSRPLPPKNRIKRTLDNDIPSEIQTEIIQKIPDTKSVIRCRSVSKAWRAEIDSKEFVKAHTLRHQAHNRHHLLIRTHDCSDCKYCTGDARYSSRHWDHCSYTPVKYYSVVDDDTFPHQKVSVFVPDLVDKFNVAFAIILGDSHGLLCLYEYGKDIAVIWNPSIRKTVSIAVPKLLQEKNYLTRVGFGVCPRNLDPKLVKITFVDDLRRLHDVNASTQVEVFTITSGGGTWRSPLSSSNFPHKLIEFRSSQVVVDGFIYWVALNSINVEDGFRNPKLIMSFDLTSEEFTKLNLPDCLALNPEARISLSNLRESLAVLDFKFNREYRVWMMIGHGCTRSFNKLYSINAPGALRLRNTLGFQKSGAPIIEVDIDKENNHRHECALAIYEPESKSITSIGIYGLRRSFYVHSYTETLLLHGH